MLKHLIYIVLAVCFIASAIATAQPDTPATNMEHEFDAGSRVSIAQLSRIQIDNLAIAGKVWGFLKYHHPAVVSGQHPWDYELLRILPEILAATDRARADVILHRWIARLGPVAQCHPCMKLEKQDFQLLPDLDWLNDPHLLSVELRTDLVGIYRNRSSAWVQSYVSLAPNIENPVFDNEADYKELKFPDAGFQLLSLFRFWNIVEYWAPTAI